MASYLVSYDLRNTSPSPYSTFLAAATGQGWSEWIVGSDDQKYRLPNTTLVGRFPSMDAALKAFSDAKAAAERTLGTDTVVVEKYIVVEYSAARFASDVKQKA